MTERPPAGFIWRVLAPLGREDARATFVEGLFLGAMIGAAIAGSTLWSRVYRRRPRSSTVRRASSRNSTLP